MSELLSEKIELEDKLCQAQQDLQHLENKLQVQEVECDVCIQTKWMDGFLCPSMKGLS